MGLLKTFLHAMGGGEADARPAATAQAEMRGNPIVIDPTHKERIAQVEYRIGAIDRYLAQEPERARPIPADKREHLIGERAAKMHELATLKRGN